ncbi:hypothetical protein O181_075563 [Austropuccinia psidii MF-1]|uniref:Uncharacterized protein n=1 Tax=Austropuccinia psidii MF-1 TaxID=1389203 RepID=A0A9Q3F951_9BASI|nr:hypothetical protein [Austropuccinia psidii MF-1]
MEDAKTSTSSQRLPSTFDILIESPEAEITANTVVRPGPFPTGNNRNIPVSVQELVYGSKAAGVGTSSKSLDRNNEVISSSEEHSGPRKKIGCSEELDTHVLQRTSPTDKCLVEKSKHVVRGPKEEVGPRKGQQTSGSSPSPHKKKSASTSSKQGQANPKEKSEGKGKGKAQVEQALPTEIKNSQEREDSQGKCVQYGKMSDGIQKQGKGKKGINTFHKKDLVKLVNHFEICNKEILAKLNNSEYIQQKLGREILQVRES